MLLRLSLRLRVSGIQVEKDKGELKKNGKAKAKAAAEVRKAQNGETAGTQASAPSSADPGVKSSQEELLRECTDLVCSLKLKALRSPLAINHVGKEPPWPS